MTTTNLTYQILNNSPAPNPFLEENGAMPEPVVTEPLMLEDLFSNNANVLWKVDLELLRPHIRAYYERTMHFSDSDQFFGPEESRSHYQFFLTNENYQYELPNVSETGGITAGVSMLLPFSLAVYSGAEYAFSLDNNANIPLGFVPVFSALLMMAPTRLHFLSLITGTPTPEDLSVEQIKEISSHQTYNQLQLAPYRVVGYREAILKALLFTITEEAPQQHQANIYSAVEFFFNKFANADAREILKREYHGRGGPLSSEDAYQRMRQLVLSGKMTGIVGDISNGGFPKIMEIANDTGEKIRVINVSNAPDWVYTRSVESKSKGLYNAFTGIYNFFLELSIIEDPDNVQVMSADYLPHVNTTSLREYLARNMPLNQGPEEAVRVYEKFMRLNIEISKVRGSYELDCEENVRQILADVEYHLDAETEPLFHESAMVLNGNILATTEFHNKMYFSSQLYRLLSIEEMRVFVANLVHLGVLKRDSFDLQIPIQHSQTLNMIQTLDTVSDNAYYITNFNDISIQSVDNSDYEGWAKSLSTEVGVASNGMQDNVRTALYPLSGYSLPDVVASFPNAETYILVSDNRFLNREYGEQYKGAVSYLVDGVKEQQVYLAEARISGWKPSGFVENVSQVWQNIKNKGALPRILARMKAAYPDVVFYRAIVWHGGYRGNSPFAKEFYSPRHGMLEFSLTPNGQRKTMFFIDAHITMNDDELVTLNDIPLDVSGVDGVLIKGSQGIFSNSQRAINYFTGPLIKNGGVLVEGVTESVARWELGGNNSGESSVSTFDLSYRKGMKVTGFKPNQDPVIYFYNGLSKNAQNLIDQIRKSSVATYKVTEFEDVTSDAKDTKGSIVWGTTVRGLSREIIFDQPSQILYPFSGYDLSGAVSTFPEAGVYIMTSENPFMPESFSGNDVKITYVVKPHDDTSSLGRVGYQDDVTAETKSKGTLSMMMGDLKSAYPNVIFKFAQIFIGEKNSLDVPSPVPTKSTPIHGTLTFSLGENEPDKTVIFIQSHVNQGHDVPTLNGAPLNIDFVDGIMVKGSQSMLTGKPRAYEYLTKPLRVNNGWLVEGVGGRIGSKYELTPENQARGIFISFLYSYREGMLFTKFEDSPSEQHPQNTDKAQPVISGVIIENEDEDEGSIAKRKRRTSLDNTTNAVTTAGSITVPASLGNTTGVVNTVIQTPLIRK